MRRLIVCLLALCAVIMSHTAHAHPRKESETDISFNVQTGKTEIIHRFRIPDAEDAIQEAYGDDLDLIENEKVRLAFGFYVMDHFMLSVDGMKVETELIGAEINDGWLWVYFEAPPLPESGVYILRFNALMDTHPEQANLVNVRLFGEVKSFALFRQSPWVTFSFD